MKLSVWWSVISILVFLFLCVSNPSLCVEIKWAFKYWHSLTSLTLSMLWLPNYAVCKARLCCWFCSLLILLTRWLRVDVVLDWTLRLPTEIRMLDYMQIDILSLRSEFIHSRLVPSAFEFIIICSIGQFEHVSGRSSLWNLWVLNAIKTLQQHDWSVSCEL